MTRICFAVAALAWGFTWYAIRLQLGPVPDDVSIFWRFFLAALLLWAWLIATGRWHPVTLRQHPWFAALGATLFSANFLLFYAAERFVPSGVVSVIFSIATVFNVFNQRIFLGIRPTLRVLAGAGLGTLGVALLFADQLAPLGAGDRAALGIALALAGTYLFSLGNLLSRQATSDGTSLPNALARGMAWGAALLAGIVVARGQSILPALSVAYLGGLLYLSVVGSVLGFLAYLSLVRRIGPERAAYVTIVSPIIALAVSTMLEGYVWNVYFIAGLPLILLGNLVIFFPRLRTGVGVEAGVS